MSDERKSIHTPILSQRERAHREGWRRVWKFLDTRRKSLTQKAELVAFCTLFGAVDGYVCVISKHLEWALVGATFGFVCSLWCDWRA